MIKTTKPTPRQADECEEATRASGCVPCLLTVKNVAKRLQVSERTVHRLIDAGELAVIRIGRSVRITETALHALLTRGDTP